MVTTRPSFRLMMWLWLTLAAFGLASPAGASTESEVQTSWRLLDYIAVDYREAVADGKIVNRPEYDEMVEFSRSVTERLQSLPERTEKARLLSEGMELRTAIDRRASPEDIAGRARSLAASLLAAYPVPQAPAKLPDLARGAQLYAQNCASCHGAAGEGPTGAFAELDPAPIAFAERGRASERSLFSLYQVISQGLEETAMQSYAFLPEEDRWALAFHVGTLAYGDAARGEEIWKGDPKVRSLVPNLAALVALTPADLAAQIGPERAAAVIAFLRSSPNAIGDNDRSASLALVRDRLAEALDNYRSGNAGRAKDLALSAYLDGFEPIEGVLATRDAALMSRVEQAMAAIRVSIARGEPVAELERRLAQLEPMLDEAEAALAPEAASDAATFLGAFAILLREGLEALLVVIAMIAFLNKAQRPEALRYVHGGWVAALVAGAGTWALATYAISISGAERELTEGFGSLLAAVILLSVGIWMHGKSQADEWRRYIATKMQGAVSRGSAWFLFGLAFIVVYREVFETILFYAALWTADNGGIILGGALTAVAVLAAIAWAMLRLSKTLPVGRFFAWSAILIAVLAVILAGKGVGALQEAGMIGVTPLPSVPRIDILGVVPTAEAIGAQLLTMIAVAAGFIWAGRPRPVLDPPPLPAE